MEVLHLHDVYIDPIRAAGADGDFNEEVATRLVESFDFRGVVRRWE